MSSVFQPSFMVAEDNSAIALRHIESLNLTRDDEDRTVDALKDDKIMIARTVSGATYVISSRKQMSILSKQYNLSADPVSVRDAIFERWVSFNN
jgi:hypothetical protein